MNRDIIIVTANNFLFLFYWKISEKINELINEVS